MSFRRWSRIAATLFLLAPYIKLLKENNIYIDTTRELEYYLLSLYIKVRDVCK